MRKITPEDVMVVAAGGFLGGLLRTVLNNLISNSDCFWVSTLVINLTGAYGIGYFVRKQEESENPEKWARWRMFLCVGLFGAYTTFSGFAWNLLILKPRLCALYCILTLAGGIGACALGYGLFSKKARSRRQ